MSVKYPGNELQKSKSTWGQIVHAAGDRSNKKIKQYKPEETRRWNRHCDVHETDEELSRCRE